ncbi:non-specific lipid-transfer protein 8 [Coffea arabica]|uniref:Non-specific lipid-transfer protein n=1 Tax=Coffea arabica TaxID=13443 RepID=A0A6P6W149_COFAR|nr:non-specific lipid-transfer protein 8-like [Coffea arabica]
MRSSSQAIIFLMAAFLVLFLIAPASDAAVTCGDVAKKIGPCVDYLRSGSGAPPPPCCGGVKALAASATTTPDKQAACACLKTESKNLNIKPELAKALPGNCGVSLPYPISPNFDCTTIR